MYDVLSSCGYRRSSISSSSEDSNIFARHLMFWKSVEQLLWRKYRQKHVWCMTCCHRVFTEEVEFHHLLKIAIFLSGILCSAKVSNNCYEENIDYRKKHVWCMTCCHHVFTEEVEFHHLLKIAIFLPVICSVLKVSNDFSKRKI